MKGADQCPKCGSRRHGTVAQDITPFYSRVLTVCTNCACAWEAFEPAQLLDDDDRYSSFKDPCDNCAFRPGSNEQQDPERWKHLMEDIKYNGGRFYCHKGVPVTPSEGAGFAYPMKDGKPDVRRLRICRGYLKMLNRQFDNLRENAISPKHAQLLTACENETLRSIEARELPEPM